MATENSPQTLFRFVSLRNPNLAESDEKNLRFIIRPPNMAGFFDSVSNTRNQTKIEALILATSNFDENSIKSVDELESGQFAELLKLGEIIASNTSLTEEQLTSTETLYNQLKTQTEAIKNLWDNLIYQYLTQTNFYVKEGIVHILKAMHVGYVQTLSSTNELERINGDDFIDNALSAKVVFPFAIFEDSPPPSSERTSETGELSPRENGQLLVLLEKEEKIHNDESEKKSLLQLKAEIEIYQKNFNVTYEKAYKKAVSDYYTTNSTKILAYETQLDVVRELEASKAPEEDIKNAYRVLKTLEVPPFIFNYKSELNWRDLLRNLSHDSLALFIAYYTDAEQKIDEPIDYDTITMDVISEAELSLGTTVVTMNFSTFNELYSEIETTSASLTIDILNQSKLPHVEYAKIGNVLVPVSDRNYSSKHLAFILKAYKPSSNLLQKTNIGHVTLQLQVESSAWSVDSAIVTAQTDSGSQKEILSDIQVVDNTLAFPLILLNKFQTIEELELQLFFSNGEAAILTLENLDINEPVTGQFVLDRAKPIDPTTTSVRHFGLKRLGIAEYMKVVQTVHAYVPGEVSDIENVMASELRHKGVNELTRTEDTLTTTKTQEVEKISDTTKTDRAEMQTEVAKEIEKQQSFQGYANFSYDSGWKIDLGTSYATNNSQYTSDRQIVAKSQEITERAMERVQSKISEERILKIIREVSLTNVHEFDNRGGLSETRPQHITGVYRWVDKKMKNQIYNYGKRTMFEFMIPEPAQLHRLAHSKVQDTLTAPVDPRKAPKPYTMANANAATDALLQYWAGIYSVTLESLPPNNKSVQRIFNAGNITPPPGLEGDYSFNLNFTLQENYDFLRYDVKFTCNPPHNGRHDWHKMVLGNRIFESGAGDGSANASYQFFNLIAPSEYKNSDFAAYCNGRDIGTFNFNFNLYYQLSAAFMQAWRQNAFDLIIQAYQTAYEAYLEEKARIEAEQQGQEGEQNESQGNFYRIIEATILKHNCIAYLLQNYLNSNTLGADFTDGDQMQNFTVYLNNNLDLYTAKAKFLEQAFEWSIMDYTFYPYYWGDRKMWQEMYLSESIDPLFRSFLQAGMARVIATVKPGFEEAVQYFLTTGKVWMGGETPIVGDPLYVSITQEMQEPIGIPQGKYWITRIPTTLTILQDKSTGLEVTQPLPIFPEAEPENCENPEELETETVFRLDDAQLSASDRNSTLG